MPAPPEIYSVPRAASADQPAEIPSRFDTEDKIKNAQRSPAQLETDLSVAANTPVEMRPPTAGPFLQDVSIDFGSAPEGTAQRRNIPLEGPDAFGHRLIERIQASGQSEIFGSRYDGKKVAQAFSEMSAMDANRYKNDKDYRKQLHDVVNTLDAPTKAYVNSLLNQVMETGKPPQIGAVEKVLANAMNNVAAKTAMPDIERLLTQNPDLRQRLNTTDAANLSPQERSLKETIDESVNRFLFEAYGPQFGRRSDASAAERSHALKGIWDYGRLPLDMKAQNGMKTDSFYEQASQASQQEIQGLLHAGRITEQERALIEKIAGQGGQMDREDRLRAFVVGGNSNIDEIKQDLRGLSPMAIHNLGMDYFLRYNSVVETDFRNRLDFNTGMEFDRLFYPRRR
jgi:DNA-binding phage protein